MIDIAALRKTTCQGSTKAQIKSLKFSKWELPTPSSRSYWDGVCAEIEKKYKRVRDPYPSLYSFFKPLPPTSTTQHYDDIKFKISPPTPLHKIQIPQTIRVDNDLLNKTVDGRKSFEDGNKLKLPPATSRRVKATLIDIKSQASRDNKVYSKKSCPRHKSASNVSIFDDKISKFLKAPDKTVTQLPSITKRKTVKCERHQLNRSKSTSASSLRSKEELKPVIEQVREKRVTKPPKLGAASLLPSFAKAISIDSSAETRESVESEEEPSKAQIDADSSSEKIQGRDFLRVPNLSFVSSHPSFRKLSLVDSCDEEAEEEEDIDSQEISLLSQEEFMLAEKNLKAERKILDSKQEIVREDEKKGKDVGVKVPKLDLHKKKIKTFQDYEKEYIIKALASITKSKHRPIDTETHLSSVKSVSSSEKSDDAVPKIIKLKNRKDEPPVNYKEIHKKLRNSLVNKLDDSLNKKFNFSRATLQKTESVTIRSASRSTSGPSPDFDDNAIVIPSTGVLEKIPSTKVFNRAKIDLCHACLHKPFKTEVKIKRELPLTTLKSVVHQKPLSTAFSSSSSSVSSEEVPPLLDDDIDEERDFNDFLERISAMSKKSMSSDDIESKDLAKVSFETAKTPTPKSGLEPAFAKDKRLMRLQSDYMKDKSLSVQSSDRSKTSTPSNLSSDSDDAHLQDADKMPPSKFMAPCHAPINWRPSLEPLRALKLKKYMSIKARDAAITAKSEEGTDSESEEEMTAADKLLAAKKLEEAGKADDEKGTKKKKKKKKKDKTKKPLVRIKSVVEKMTEFSSSIDLSEIKDKKMLKRAKTTFDLLATSDESESEESEDEAESKEEVTVEETKEEIPYSDAILKYRAGSPPPPIMSTEDIVDIVKLCLEDEFNPPNLLNKLSNEFTKKLEDKCKLLGDSDDANSLKLGLKLFQALIDSRRYLKATTYDPNLKFSHKQPLQINSRQLKRILPAKSYELVAPILRMSKNNISLDMKTARVRHQALTTDSEDNNESELTFDLIVHPPSERISSSGKAYTDKYSTVYPYVLFLRKSRRKAVVWRPLRPEDLKGYDPEATLEMRAARLMDRICKDFCQWLNQLGGKEQVIDEETLKDMFEINFTAEACKAMQVLVKEMPTVPLAVSKARKYQAASELEATRKQIHRDLRAEKQSKRVHAFGRSLPSKLRYIPPQGSGVAKWLSCKYIPKDLESMDVVWKGIMHLDSIRAFIGYLKANPQVSSPKLLRNLVTRKVEPVTFKKLDELDDLSQHAFEFEKVTDNIVD